MDATYNTAQLDASYTSSAMIAPMPAPDVPSDARIGRGRGRRPSEEVRAEILEAAGRLLLDHGMGAFTIERVAAESGASKMTIYKWWPSKGVLALEGYSATVDATLTVPDTGDIRDDLATQLVTFVTLLRTTPAGRVTAELFGAAQTDPKLAAALQSSYSLPRRAAGRAALLAAQERRQIRADVDPDILIDQLWGACLYRLMIANLPLSDDFARGLVENLINGVAVRD